MSFTLNKLAEDVKDAALNLESNLKSCNPCVKTNLFSEKMTWNGCLHL